MSIILSSEDSVLNSKEVFVVVIWSVPFRDQFSILAKSVTNAFHKYHYYLNPCCHIFEVKIPPNVSLISFYLSLAIILMLSRGVIVTAANYHSDPPPYHLKLTLTATSQRSPPPRFVSDKLLTRLLQILQKRKCLLHKNNHFFLKIF